MAGSLDVFAERPKYGRADVYGDALGKVLDTEAGKIVIGYLLNRMYVGSSISPELFHLRNLGCRILNECFAARPAAGQALALEAFTSRNPDIFNSGF